MKNETMNQDINNARIIGYLQGTINAAVSRVKNENCVFTREEIADAMEKANEIAEKWFSLRYEGPFMPEDIRFMIGFEKAKIKGQVDQSDVEELKRVWKEQQSDIVELERA
jgi:hypothetical protein